MTRRITILLLLICFATFAANADEIHLKNGRVMHVERAEVVGDMVQFHVFNGTMSIAKTSVVKIVKTQTAVNTRSAFTPGYSEAATTPVSNENADQTSQYKPTVNLNYGSTRKLDFLLEPSSADDTHAANYNTIAAMKLLLEKAYAGGQSEVSRLQNLVYTKTSLGSSTTAEKNQIAQIQAEMQKIKGQLSQFRSEARRAGLDEQDIATIESLRYQNYSMDDLAQVAGQAIMGTMMELMKDSMQQMMQETMNQMSEGMNQAMDQMNEQVKDRIMEEQK
jgi:hypothetical protein